MPFVLFRERRSTKVGGSTSIQASRWQRDPEKALARRSRKLACSFIKDDLLSKVGIVKEWWEEREEENRKTDYDLTDDQFALLAQAVMESSGAMKIVAHSAHDPARSTAKTKSAN